MVIEQSNNKLKLKANMWGKFKVQNVFYLRY